MKLKVLVLILLPFFVLQGCNTKKTTPIPSQITPQSDENGFESFDEEFVEEEEEIDPLAPYNRVMTSINDTFFIYALNPIAKTYGYIIPQPVRLGISNFIDNITFPVRFTNTILQGKFAYTAEECERFIVNSTIGIGGLFDPATDVLHLASHEEDFGQTLGYYGVGAGFPIVLPLMGPSNLRDSVGMTADWYLSPLTYTGTSQSYKLPKNGEQNVAISTVITTNKTSLNLGKYEDFKKDALDLYPFLRDTYAQKREAQIKE
ncbi:MAG: lipid asymmetry transporter MlaABCDEF, lipoprotein MlaA [Pseudomonadota bacterium]